MPEQSHPAAKGAVLVMGASRGLGRAIVTALVAAGIPVAAVCRKLDDAKALAQETDGQAVLPLVADVTDLDQVRAAVDRAAGWKGGLRGLVNNAGVIEPIGRIDQTDPQRWAQLIQVNVTGAYHAIHAALPHLQHAAAPGVVVNVSSGAAAKPYEGWSGYCASKAALAMLTRSVEHEFQGSVRSYGFRPGVVDTGMQAEIRASGLNPVSQIPRGELLPPEVPAGGVLWLLQQAPADLSGTEVDIRDEAFLSRLSPG